VRGGETVETKKWEPMKVTDVGHVGDVVQGGQGKLSPPDNDPGEAKKPLGNEP